MKVIDQINGSALFAQSAYSASVATKDNLGRDITTTYLTEINLPESATWNDTSDVVKESSASWNQGKTYEGISPIVVNNDENVVSADTWTFSAGSNVSFVDDNVNKITRIDVELPQPQDLSYISAQTDKANQGVDYLSGVVITALPSDMATTGDVAELAQTISETYQTKGDYLVRSDSANFYPANNPSGFITGVDLSNYYTKDETSGKEELANAFANIPVGDPEVNAYVTSNSASIDESTDLVQSNSSTWNDVTAYQSNSGSYLTAIDIPESATWNDVSETVQTNSSVWNDKLDSSSLDLKIGNSFIADPSITGAYQISGAYILALNAYRDSQGREITGYYQLKDNNLLSGTKYGTLKIDNENTHLVDTTFSALSSYEGIVVSAIPYSGAGYWNGYSQDTGNSTTSHSYDNVKSYSINMQSWDGGFTAQINGTNYDNSYFDGNHTITGEFNTPSTLVVNLYRSNNYMQPNIKQFNLSAVGEINEVVDIRNVFATNEQLNTASSFLSGAIDYVSANAGGGSTGNYALKSDFTFVTDQWGTYLQKVSGKYIDYATRAGQAEQDSNGHTITAQYFTTANANTLSSMLSAAIDYVSANAGDEFPISADEAIQYVQTNSAQIDETVTSFQTNSSTYMVEPNLEYNAVNEISGYNGSAIAQYGAEKQWLVHDGTLCHLSNSAQYALGCNISALQRLMGIDETVLWSGSPTTFTAAFTASESISNFDKIKVSHIIYTDNEYIQENHEYESDAALLTNEINVGFSYIIDNGWKCWGAEKYHITNGTDFTIYRAGRNFIGPNTTAGQGYNDNADAQNGWIYKVVGIGRKQ